MSPTKKPPADECRCDMTPAEMQEFADWWRSFRVEESARKAAEDKRAERREFLRRNVITWASIGFLAWLLNIGGSLVTWVWDHAAELRAMTKKPPAEIRPGGKP